MPRATSEKPTELELEILKVLWTQSPLVVRDIRDRLASAGRDIAHTSVITMLNIMVDKRYLKKRKVGKSFLYWPIVSERDATQKLLHDLMYRAFSGSAERLVLNLLDRDGVDEAELLALRQLINKKVREQRQ
jgi:BlaI family transcriptional regulator, penicillinase repressor